MFSCNTKLSIEVYNETIHVPNRFALFLGGWSTIQPKRLMTSLGGILLLEGIVDEGM
jgi:hypothetical protein